jgi:hypothetical protein
VVFVKILDGVEPVTKVISVVRGGLVTFKIVTVMIAAGLAQAPFNAFTEICPPDKPADAVISLTEELPLQPLGMVQT